MFCILCDLPVSRTNVPFAHSALVPFAEASGLVCGSLCPTFLSLTSLVPQVRSLVQGGSSRFLFASLLAAFSLEGLSVDR